METFDFKETEIRRSRYFRLLLKLSKLLKFG